MKFIVDHNVGKLAKRLRLMGYDTVFFHGPDDADMIACALSEDRVLLTRDTRVMKRGVITGGRITALLINGDKVEEQLTQIVRAFDIHTAHGAFSICFECNHNLREIGKEEVRDRVPPYVFQTQKQYMECPKCHRIYWRGTHWQKMNDELNILAKRGKTDDK
ncbi:Mut7-C RNAse domain-containing protein [Chloroflexota bacterium]